MSIYASTGLLHKREGEPFRHLGRESSIKFGTGGRNSDSIPSSGTDLLCGLGHSASIYFSIKWS